jgi:hypothetical protein
MKNEEGFVDTIENYLPFNDQLGGHSVFFGHKRSILYHCDNKNIILKENSNNEDIFYEKYYPKLDEIKKYIPKYYGKKYIKDKYGIGGINKFINNIK